MFRRCALALLYVTGLVGAVSGVMEWTHGAEVALIPEPVSLQAREGQFRFTADTQVWASGPAAAEACKMIDALTPALGFKLKLTDTEAANAAQVALALDHALQTNSARKDTPWKPRPRESTSARVPVFDDDGELRGYRGISRDISARKKAEEQLRKSEEKYRHLVENISDVIYTSNEDGIITYASPTVAALSGYQPAEIIVGISLSSFIRPILRW